MNLSPMEEFDYIMKRIRIIKDLDAGLHEIREIEKQHNKRRKIFGIIFLVYLAMVLAGYAIQTTYLKHRGYQMQEKVRRESIIDSLPKYVEAWDGKPGMSYDDWVEFGKRVGFNAISSGSVLDNTARQGLDSLTKEIPTDIYRLFPTDRLERTLLTYTSANSSSEINDLD